MGWFPPIRLPFYCVASSMDDPSVVPCFSPPSLTLEMMFFFSPPESRDLLISFRSRLQRDRTPRPRAKKHVLGHWLPIPSFFPLRGALPLPTTDWSLLKTFPADDRVPPFFFFQEARTRPRFLSRPSFPTSKIRQPAFSICRIGQPALNGCSPPFRSESLLFPV